MLDLIYNEVVLREEAGDAPRLDEYLRRFPQYDPDIRLQFQVHWALEAGGSLGDMGEGASPTTVSGSRVAPGADGAGGDVAVPGYEILGELGRGGMGVVYLARQVELKRRVALKMILAGAQAGPKERGRFRVEAEAVARLQHPNIVQIYEVGERAGRPYSSMELAPGGGLDRALAGTPWPARRAAALAETLARAMQYVHDRGILHRDLKPSNVLLAADGSPKITDFGLAKLLDAGAAAAGRTPSEAMLGTPSYMAPEQAAGRPGAIGVATDVYALGAILYELLTGRPPFRAATPLDTAMLVVTAEPVPPGRLQPKIPRDVELICLKCLEKEPVRRYADAGAMADDLGRFLADEPIRARPTPVWRRAAKWARRRPAVAALAGVGVVALVALVTLAAWSDLAERRRLGTLRAEGQRLVFRGQAALADDLPAAKSHATGALARIGREPALAAVSSQARRLLDEADRRLADQAARRAARSRREAFDGWRDEVLFLATRPADAGAAESLRQMEAAAREALAAAGIAPEAGRVPAVSPIFNEADRAAIAEGGRELLLVLADALTQPTPGRSAGDGRDRAAHALRALDLAAGLGRPMRADHLRRARALEILEDRPASAAERRRAEAITPAGAADAFLAGVDAFLGDEGRPDLSRAIRHLEDALGARPDHFWARYYLAICHLNAGRPDLARAHLTACLGRRPGFAWLYLLRGFGQPRRCRDRARDEPGRGPGRSRPVAQR